MAHPGSTIDRSLKPGPSMRAVIYARYSSDLQREASIADQVEVCRRYIEAQGWTLGRIYSDAALSGASRHRPGFQALTKDAGARQFDVVVCEAVDRLGRRLADTADLQDTLTFYGIRLFTPGLGEITTIHVAVMGMMAQMALKDLGEKTKRGQLGRVLKGKVPAGIAYGYRAKASSDGDGRGDRLIDDTEAEVVRRIFADYAAGQTPEAIAKALNREGVPGPGGRPWSNTTLRGQPARGTGLLNNSLYAGELVWNRCSYVKDPRTGKRIARPNPPEAWETTAVPELRIVTPELWQAVRGRLADRRWVAVPDADGRSSLNKAKGPRFLLSGKAVCGHCGGPFSVIGRERFGCAKAARQGTCDNTTTITRQALEGRVLVGLKDRLLAPDLLETFITEYQAAVQAERKKAEQEASQRERKLAEVRRKIAGVLAAIEDGLYEPSFKDRLAALRQEEAALIPTLDIDTERTLALVGHPRIAEAYRRKVEALEAVLDGPDGFEARELIRSMIERVTLSRRSESQGLDAELSGDLAAILAACEAARDNKKLPRSGDLGSQTIVVAGARFELTTFRL